MRRQSESIHPTAFNPSAQAALVVSTAGVQRNLLRASVWDSKAANCGEL
jgi:hypothetical protein